MSRQLEQFAFAIEKNGGHLPPNPVLEDARQHPTPHMRYDRVAKLVETIGRVAFTVAPGVHYRCPATLEAAQRLAGKLRRAKLPKRDRQPTPGTVSQRETEARAVRYTAHLQANKCTTITLWPDSVGGHHKTWCECELLARLTDTPIPTTMVTREMVRSLIRKAKQHGYTIRYADPEGDEPPREI